MTHSPESSGGDIDRLPLSMIQLESKTLKSAQLVKTAQLETMVELHCDAKSGSLQIRPQDIAKNFKISAADQTTLEKLSTLKSYDVYSLRGNLEKLGIQVDEGALELSDDMKARLNAASHDFTRPLILNIFGDGTDSPDDPEGLTKLFRSPDVRLVQARLQLMSQKTGIPVGEIPAFLKKYADLFQSGAYYRQGYETLSPDLQRFGNWMGDLKTRQEITASQGAHATCKKVEDALAFLRASIDERLGEFRKGFETFWDDMNKKTFERLRRQVEANYAGIGAMLCGVTVKMRDWSNTFPDNDTGGTQGRLTYVAQKLEPGLEHLRTAETEARKTAWFN